MTTADPTGAVRRIDLDRGDGTNALDDALVERVHSELDDAQRDPVCRMVVFTSASEVFSTGMDLAAAGSGEGGHRTDQDATDAGRRQGTGAAFFDLLHRLTEVPLLVAAVVEGRAAGGGVGLVAASDLVLATPSSTFALPEALWGLLPCCVLPFLARRTGFQRAYTMTLTTTPLDAERAAACGLVDEIAERPEQVLRRLAFRVTKLDPTTLADAKRYAATLSPIPAGTRERAVAELERLMAQPRVRERLTAFAEYGRFPWQS